MRPAQLKFVVAKIGSMTIGQKLVALLVVGLGLVFAIGGVSTIITETKRADALSTNAVRKLTELMAAHAGQSERLDRSEPLYTAFSIDANPDPHFRLAGIELIDNAGNSLDSFTEPGMRLPSGGALRQLAARAAIDDRVHELRASDLYLVAVPIHRLRHPDGPVGALAAAWDLSQLSAEMMEVTIVNGAIGAAAAIVAIIVVLVLLRRLVIQPVDALTGHVVTIGRTGDLTRAMPASLNGRQDEIGVLAREFRILIARVSETKEQALEQSYYGGMAEMAAGVLHNIRNALSPITIALWESRELLKGGASVNLERALAELQDPATAADRRTKLMAFVKLAVAKLLQQQQTAGERITGIVGHHRHIEQILQDHSLFARGSRRLSSVELGPLLTHAGDLVRTGKSPAVRVEIEAEIAALPAVKADPLVLEQVFSNLFVNAVDSIRDAGRAEGLITVGAMLETLDGHAAVHLVVSDNGTGIAPEAVGSLFRRGFSTKKGKTGGLGLHWCANSVAAMNGRIHAESAGIGSGASFHLVFPVALAIQEAA
jgi:signal transduction histidine kinase